MYLREQAEQQASYYPKIHSSAATGRFQHLRSQIIALVTAVLIFNIVLLVLDILILSQNNQDDDTGNFTHILSIIADGMCLAASIFEWNCLYFYRDHLLKLLIYGTIVTYTLVLSTKVAQFSTKVGGVLRAQEIGDIVCALVILIVGLLKSKLTQKYCSEGAASLKTDLSEHLNSEEEYQNNLKMLTES